MLHAKLQYKVKEAVCWAVTFNFIIRRVCDSPLGSNVIETGQKHCAWKHCAGLQHLKCGVKDRGEFKGLLSWLEAVQSRGKVVKLGMKSRKQFTGP